MPIRPESAPRRQSTAAPIRARDIHVSRGSMVVLDAIDLTVADGDRVGLVGPNGVGKSTLLQVLAGAITPDRGAVELTPPTATVGYLQQELPRDDETVAAFLERRTGVAAASRELDVATAELAAGRDGADTRYDVALQRWMALGAADLEARIGAVLADLGLSPDVLGQPTRSLSGGEAARAGLAALVLSRFDVFLLDEPTNDLDLAGLARLERWVLDVSGAVVLVSHDRTFLARTLTTVLELDEFTHRGTRFGGGWQSYLDERAAADRLAWERFEDYDSQRSGLASRAQREREWATQGLSKAKKSGERDKFIRNFKIDQTEQLAGRAARTDRAIERLDVVDKPRVPWSLKLEIPAAGRPGDVVARCVGLVVERDTSERSFTLGPIDVLIGAGERIALVGPNGSGKSTLLAALLGTIEPTAGAVHVGPSVVIGEVAQARDQLTGEDEHADRPLLRVFQDITGMDASDARTLLAKFGLVADHVLRPAATLSPGERTRASLAVLMAGAVNVLVLDEPTNHLDLPAIEQLEVALDAFGGTIILVSHDRTLLDAVALTRRIELRDGTIVLDEPVTRA